MIKFIARCIVVFLYNITLAIRSLFWNRDKAIVLFGAWFGDRYADNPRFLFQYLSDNKESLGLRKVVWVSRNRQVIDQINDLGYEAYYMYSKESIYFHKKAGTHFICESCDEIRSRKGDIIGKYSFAANRVNLWHGTGAFKLVNYGTLRNNENSALRLKKYLHTHFKVFRVMFEQVGGWGDFYILATSEQSKNQWQEYFALADKRYIRTGYPRNNSISKLLPAENEVICILRKYKYKVLYLPTFRENIIDQEYVVKDECFKTLSNSGILVIKKAHGFEKNWKTKYGLDDNVLSLNPQYDINTILPYADMIITDYSSVAVDGLYHNIPVVFFAKDYSNYMIRERGFVQDINERFFSDMIDNEDELIDTIIDCCNNPDKYKTEKYYTQREIWWDNEKSNYEIWNDIKAVCLQEV